MAGDKRPILSSKRTRSRRKRAALKASNRANASPTPECDNETIAHSRGDSSSSGKNTSQSEGEGEDGLVFVCRPTTPDFCSIFLPRSEEHVYSRSRRLHASTAECKTFVVQIPTFRETSEGFVMYSLEITTVDEPRYTFTLERRFSEFVACAAEVNKQLATHCHLRQEEEESKDGESDIADSFQWELPAKTWFRVTQTSALEERRAQLELSLVMLLLQQDRRMCNLPVLRDFLMLDIFGVQVAEQKMLDVSAHFE